jgi:hypothetical protein
MRNTVFALLGVTAGAIALVGCSNKEPVDEIAPAFTDGQGQQAHNSKPYPEGPYGIGKGSVITNYKFIGYVNSVSDSTTLVEIQMAEFYNPDGNGVFEEGSVFPVGTPKPKALLIPVASVWCGPCNYEAESVLPGLYKEYKPQGGEFFAQIADGPTPGKAATQKSLYNWANKYDVDYPIAIDPTYQLGALFEADAFPANMIIDPRTMKIVEVISGVAEEGGPFWTTYQKVMKGEIQP